MKKNKKLLLALGLGVIASAITVPAVLTSCGDQKSSSTINSTTTTGTTTGTTTETTTGTTTGTSSQSSDTLSQISDINKDVKLNAEEKATKSVLITDDGDITDKSFNQSAYEGLIKALKDLNVDENLNTAYLKPSQDSSSAYIQAYKQAISDGNKYIILNGFKHNAALHQFLKDPANQESVANNNVVFICLDFDASDLAPQGHIISLLFQSKDAGWLVGYAAAEYLSHNKDQAKRYVSALGGMDIPPVTDYIDGFLKGILYWNNHQKTQDTKIKYLPYDNSTKVQLGINFTASQQVPFITQDVTLGYDNKKSSVIFPVAGAATSEVLKQAAQNNEGQVVIGVDVDQSKAFSPYKNYLLTSALKEIGEAIYDTMGYLYSNNKTALSKFGGFEFGVKNGVKKGDKKHDNWSGISNSTLTSPLGQQAVNDAKKAFDSLSDTELDYIHSNKATPNGEEIVGADGKASARLDQLVDLINK